MAETEIQGFVTSTQELLDVTDGLNEQATCESIITKFIAALGWEEVDKQRPFQVQMGSRDKEVDYALFVGAQDEPQVFVEAKPEKRALRGEHMEQLKSYMVQEWVEWGLLTNGRQYQLVRLTASPSGAPDLRVLVDATLDNIASTYLPDILRKSAIESGEAEQLGDDMQARLNAVDVLRGHPAILGQVAVEAGAAGTDDEDIGGRVVEGLNQRLVVEAKEAGESGPPPDGFKHVARGDLDGDDDARFAFVSSRPNGVDFLREHTAWGFVGEPRRDPEYMALYISSPVQKLKYVGKIERVVPVREFGGIDEATKQQHDGRYVLDLENVIELEDPLPFGDGKANVRGLTYTTLGRIKNADTIDDL